MSYTLDNYIGYLKSRPLIDTEEEIMIYYNLCIYPDNIPIRERLIEGHLPYVLEVAKSHSKGRNSGNFQEILSSMVMAAYELGYRYNPGTDHLKLFKEHLTSDLKHLVSKMYRSKKREIPTDMDTLDIPAPKSTISSALTDIINDVIATEFGYKRMVLRYRFCYGYSNRKIAKLVGISNWTVGQIVKRGKHKLRKKIAMICQE